MQYWCRLINFNDVSTTLANTPSKSDWHDCSAFSQEYCEYIYWLILGNNEKAALNINKPYWKHSHVRGSRIRLSSALIKMLYIVIVILLWYSQIGFDTGVGRQFLENLASGNWSSEGQPLDNTLMTNVGIPGLFLLKLAGDSSNNRTYPQTPGERLRKL